MNTRDYLNGNSSEGYNFFGGHKRKSGGYIFRLLAPSAESVSLIGDFNDWQESPMRKYSTGVFSVSIKDAKPGDKYQYLIKGEDGIIRKKIDPFSKKLSLKNESSVLVDESFKFKYKKVKKQAKNIYQVHLGSLLKQDKKPMDIYKDLVLHLKENNFSHLQLMPVSEYKNYKQRGYSSLNLFAFSERYGDLSDFKKFIDLLHKEKIALIIELDLAEFDKDPIYLDNFDGTNLYNYDYDNIKYNYWGSINFDPSKNLVKSYLLSLVDYYSKKLNIDGIFFSSVENMIYWQADKNRGVNDSWLELIRNLNQNLKDNNVLSIAGFNGIYEDYDLGFDLIYDNEFRSMVDIFKKPPIDRANYKLDIENIVKNSSDSKILGFSHVDSSLNEASLAMKMYSEDMKISQLKTLMLFLYSLKSSKLIFMGDEFSDFKTFSVYEEFNVKNFGKNQITFNNFFKDLTLLFYKEKALSNNKSICKLLDIEGYSIYAFERKYNDQELLIIVNFTDIEYEVKNSYKLKELINTNDLAYDGDGNINGDLDKNDNIFLGAFNSAIFKIIK